jgi:hypothetical protein
MFPPKCPVIPKHGISFTGASLSIHEQGAVNALEGGHDDGPDRSRVDVGVGLGRRVAVVEMEQGPRGGRYPLGGVLLFSGLGHVYAVASDCPEHLFASLPGVRGTHPEDDLDVFHSNEFLIQALT